MCILSACTQKPAQTKVPDRNFNPPSHTTVEPAVEQSATESAKGNLTNLELDSLAVLNQDSVSTMAVDSTVQEKEAAGLQVGDAKMVTGERNPVSNDGGIASGHTGDKEAKSGKETPKPALDLNTIPTWVKELMAGNFPKTEIQRSSKDGMDYFKVNRCVGCSDNMLTIFDENQKSICQIGGITGRDTCAEQGLSFSDWEVIYQSPRDAKIEKPSGSIFKNK